MRQVWQAMEQQQGQPAKAMAKTQVSVRGRVALTFCVSVALAAVLWPQGKPTQLHGSDNTGNGSLEAADWSSGVAGLLLSSCPLGYTASSPGQPANPHAFAQQTDAAGMNAWGTQRPQGAKRQLGIWTNGTIWTGVDESEVVEALLVDESEGAVLASGTLEEVMRHAKALELQGVAGSRGSRLGTWSVMHDLQGRFLMPGIVDAHVHFLQAGIFLSTTQLRGVSSKEQFQAAVRKQVAKLEALEQQQHSQGAHENTTHASAPSPPVFDSAIDENGSRAGVEKQQEATQQQQQSLHWVEGGGWDEGLWPGHQLPDASWLDEATGPNRPALLSRMDSHMAVANTAALKLAGLLLPSGRAAEGAEETFWYPPVEVEGGHVDRHASGRPTGMLRENAIDLVARMIPAPDQATVEVALQAASDYALAHGVTTVACLGRAPFTRDLDSTWQDLEHVFTPAADQGKLRLRVVAFTPLKSWQRLVARAAAHGHLHPSGRLITGGVKEFLDGSLGSRTALMWRPYNDAQDGSVPAPPPSSPPSSQEHTALDTAAGNDGPEGGEHNVHGGNGTASDASLDGEVGHAVEYGTRMISLTELYRLVQGADAAGLTVAVHAIGDRAVDELLDVYERVRHANQALHAGLAKAHGTAGSGPVTSTLGPMHRIEHMQHLSSGPAVAARAARLHVAAVPNPQHLLTDGALMHRRLGAQRAGARHSYAFHSLLQHNVTLGLSSDWPVVELNALGSVYASVFRRPWSETSTSTTPEHLPLQARTKVEQHVRQEGEQPDHDSKQPQQQLPPPLPPAPWSSSDSEALRPGQALLGHTRDAARTALVGDIAGVLRAGMRADFVVLDTSPFKMHPGAPLPKVLQTYVDGQCAYGCQDKQLSSSNA